MKTRNTIQNSLSTVAVATAAVFAAGLVSGCSLINPDPHTTLANPSSASQNSAGGASGTSTSVPTADAVVGRIEKGLTLPNGTSSLVSPASKNFGKVLSQVMTNLPYNSDPTKATGLEQIPLLVYAACADVNPSSYGVSTSSGQTVSSQMTNLVNAGVTMVNQHVGGLAASGTAANTQVVAVFTQLVNSDETAGASIAMTFISVCLAANSFGVGMTGF